MILVTGATGTIGGEVVKQLLAQGEKVRVLARDPAKAAKLGDGVEVAQGDFDKPETLAAACQGVDKLFLLAAGENLAQQEAAALQAAKQAGVKYVVEISAAGAGDEGGLELGRWHAAGEKHVRDSGIPWTIVRPGMFMSNTLAWAGSIKSQGVVYNPSGEGKTAPIDPKDIAAVAVAALTSAGHEGKVYEITGAQPLSTADQVGKISAAIGRPIQCIDVPEEAARGAMLGQGMSPALTNALVELMTYIKNEGTGEVTTTVEQVLGREPRTFEEWLSEHASAFR